MIQPEIKVFPDPQAIAVEAAERIARAAEEAIALSDRFTLGLAGGSTPKALYEVLAEGYRDAIDWARVEVFFGDERCVPPDHEQSNYRMAHASLLSKVPIPGDNIYRMRGEIEPEAAAKEYGLMLKEKFPSTSSGQAHSMGSGQVIDAGLDLLLLGMGEDGHTASLFPGTAAVGEMHHRCVANFAENSTTGRSWRITLTAPFINRSREVLILVAGAGKAKVLAEVLEGPRVPERLPIQLVEPASGKLSWLIDVAAAGMQEV